MVATRVYGIPNCDSCRKAVNWLKSEGYPFVFHDLRRDGPPDEARLRRWCDLLGWENVLNRRSTTYRSIPPAEQGIHDTDCAVALLLKYPLLLKRPLVESQRGCVAGFVPEQLSNILDHA